MTEHIRGQKNLSIRLNQRPGCHAPKTIPVINIGPERQSGRGGRKKDLQISGLKAELGTQRK